MLGAMATESGGTTSFRCGKSTCVNSIRGEARVRPLNGRVSPQGGVPPVHANSRKSPVHLETLIMHNEIVFLYR